MDPDMNIYDLEHLTTTHPIMSQEDWKRAYENAWKQFYTLDHVETVLRRAAARRQRLDKVMFFLLWFHGGMTIEKIHPEEGGFGRRKVRTTRRTGMPIESPLIFYPRRVWEVFSAACRWGFLIWQYHRIKERIKKDPKKREYMDLSLTPVLGHDEDNLGLMHAYGDHIPITHITKRKPVAAE